MVIWIAFIVLILFFLALDLGVFHRADRVVRPAEGLAWSLVWMTMAAAFAGFVYGAYEHKWAGFGLHPDAADRTPEAPDGMINDGAEAVIKYLTGYVVELSLSVDNMFVIAMIFRFLAVPAMYQHRLLFWGILGALTMRGIMIGIGAQLIQAFDWTLYLFGLLLIITAAKMLTLDTAHPDPGQNMVLRLLRRRLPVTDRYDGHHFMVRQAITGTVALTPLAVALVMVETTDLLFAVDSIPAIFAVTADPFLVFASNAFAVLGLRSLYFALAGALDQFRYLKVSLALVLALIGTKMLVHAWLMEMLGDYFHLYLLVAVLVILAGGIVASSFRPSHAPR